MANVPVPSLFESSGSAQAAAPATAAGPVRKLMDLLYDGFYMLFLVRNGYAPTSADEFRDRIRSFLLTLERGSQRLRAPAEDIYLAKFAFCALVDEVVLSSQLKIRDSWEQRPLQLEYFGEQLAGERFFEHLETLRQQGAPRVAVLEVFHMCLLLGFQGRYVLEGSEKLNFLTARVGDEIAHLRGKRAAFAPHWAAPDQVVHKLRGEVPLWVVGSVFALMAALAYVGFSTLLHKQTQGDLRAYADVVKLAPQAAYVSITLP
jgi:type VI secretion system protein ImpK